jgi:fumarate hydratase subunit beta
MNVHNLNIPVSRKKIQTLHIGDIVYLSGEVFTARDEAHQQLLEIPEDQLPFSIKSMGLYHCGPLMKKINNGWEVIAAGPTTSSRLELFEADLLKKFPLINILIGKGGMGDHTLAALKNRGVYLSYTGGAAALAADQITKVKHVYWLEELGMAEAIWMFYVKNFGPLIVGMDCHEKSLFKKM